MSRFFKLPKNNSFKYKPRYYDPEKAELEERIKNFERQDPDDKEAMKARIVGGFKTRGGYNRGALVNRSRAIRRANVMRLLIIAALLLACILLLT